MFGISLFVSPVTERMYTSNVKEDFSSVKSKSLYLPAGTRWTDFWTGKSVSGGAKVSKEAPLDIMPLYVKAGSILPLGPAVQYAREKSWENLEIRIYPGANGEFVLYEDENDNYNYEKGAFSTIRFVWNDAKQTLTIGSRNGSFEGMLQNRTFNLVKVSDQKGVGMEPTVSFDKVVTYTGQQLTVKL